MIRRQLGDRVSLITAASSAFSGGMLNYRGLAQEGYRGEPVTVVDLSDDGYVVRLPSGYRLFVTERDIE